MRESHRPSFEDVVNFAGVGFLPHAVAQCRRRGVSLEAVAVAVEYGKLDHTKKQIGGRYVIVCRRRILRRFLPPKTKVTSGLKVILEPSGVVLTSMRLS